MKKKVNRKLVVVLIALAAVAVCAAVTLTWGLKVRDKSNFFAYAVDLENENWAYAPKGLDYGMSAEEVIKEECLKDYTWEEEGVILRTEKIVKELFGDIKEFEFVKRYFFDSEGGLASVRYELIMDAEYEEALRELLYEQAVEYMPETNRKTDVKNIAEVHDDLAKTVNNIIETAEEDELDLILILTRIVWEDTVYQSEDSESVLQHANSDVGLDICKQLNGTLLVDLEIGRYEDRLTEAEILEQKEENPMWIEQDSLACFIILPLEVYKSDTTYIWAEVTGHYKEFNSVTTYGDYINYPIRILDDTENMFWGGEERFIRTDSSNKENTKMWKKGRQFLCPLSQSQARYDAEFLLQLTGMYYVTEDGYVIAAYDENQFSYLFDQYIVSECTLSGLKVEDFMRKLKR